MTKEELEAGLQELDDALAQAFPGDDIIQCVVVGGACLLFLGIVERSTEDIDVIIFNLLGSAEETSLIFTTPLATRIRKIVKKIGHHRFGLRGERALWWNDNCSPFLLQMSNNELPPVRLLKAYTKLHLYVPDDIRYLLALKVMAGRANKDHDDIRCLCVALNISTRTDVQGVVNRYFPSLPLQYDYKVPQTLKLLFDQERF